MDEVEAPLMCREYGWDGFDVWVPVGVVGFFALYSAIGEDDAAHELAGVV